MAIVPKFTNQGIPSDGNLGPFPSFENVGTPYMAMLSLPGLTICFPVWLFSTPMVPNVQATSQPSSSSPKKCQPHVDPRVDPSPSSLISSPHSSSSPGESIYSSNQEAKNKKKKTKKKKQNKQGRNQETIATNATDVEKPTSPSRKFKFPCKLCKGDQLLRGCPGIQRVL